MNSKDTSPSWRTPPPPIRDSEIAREYSADVIVAGLGHAGITAVRAAAEAGASVIGFEKMKLTSLLLLSQAVFQILTTPFLVYLGYGALGAVLGYTLSSVLTSIISMTLLYFRVLKYLPRTSSTENMYETLRFLLKYGVPLGVATVLASIMGQFYSFLMASY